MKLAIEIVVESDDEVEVRDMADDIAEGIRRAQRAGRYPSVVLIPGVGVATIKEEE